jgi:Transglycosylase-like domain
LLLRRLVTALAALLVLPGTAVAFGASSTEQQGKSIGREALAYYSGEIARFQKQTWHWQRVMGVPLTPSRGRRLAAMEPSQIKRAALEWQQRFAVVHAKARKPPHLQEWLCIHRFEGSWKSATGNGYYGGLQMDITFQRQYGSYLLRKKGTADRWSPLEQIWAAEKARRSRGFYPWPNTARYCGLL